jgi:hypothetical protein
MSDTQKREPAGRVPTWSLAATIGVGTYIGGAITANFLIGESQVGAQAASMGAALTAALWGWFVLYIGR